MKIVVIGGAGLIGSKTLAILRRGGHEGRRRLARKRHQHHHPRGAQRGHGRRAGRDRPRQLALIW
jgi:nucleoside-diphosphate-sugar epimerase